jgi:glycosyltransferase involved in cell wall biosynthesis
MSKNFAVIVPCYNEANRLDGGAFSKFVLENPAIEIWFANDGSTDNTLAIVQALASDNPQKIHVFNLPQNSGKAEAVRQAFLHVYALGQYSHLAFIDADLSSPLKELIPLFNQFKINQNLLLAVGVRVKMLGNTVERKALRHYISRIFATFYNLILNIPNYDTQCGLKVFEANSIPEVFGERFISKWLFDIELFLRIQGMVGRAAYEHRIREIPVEEWKEVGDSRLKISDFLNAPLEVLRIRRKYIKIIKS